MYKNGFGVNNLQWLVYHKTKPNQTKPNQTKPNQISILLFSNVSWIAVNNGSIT